MRHKIQKKKLKVKEKEKKKRLIKKVSVVNIKIKVYVELKKIGLIKNVCLNHLILLKNVKNYHQKDII